RLRGGHPDQRRLCRRAELGAQRAGRDVHPRRQPGPALVCRRGVRGAPSRVDPARWIGPGLVAVTPQLTLFMSSGLTKEKKMKMRMTSLAAIALALSLTAACATRRPRPVAP